MIGTSIKILDFMDARNERYVIPAYQRKYAWERENCQQLYSDLKKVILDKRPNHFFGSIVSHVAGKGGINERYIIDGQQRLTTIILLLLAIRNLVSNGEYNPQKSNLVADIDRLILTNDNDKVKLRAVKADREAFEKLYRGEDGVRSSKLTDNYNYFREVLLDEKEVSIDNLYDAIKKFEIISITLEETDNAQLVFESLNSTGMALSEGDKIRNYVLMGLPPRVQEDYYEKYWVKIENATTDMFHGSADVAQKDKLNEFLVDFLSLKKRAFQVTDRTYSDFKIYAERIPVEGSDLTAEALIEKRMEKVLSELLKYARLYEKLLSCKSGLGNKELDDCLYRIKYLNVKTAHPFFMEVLRLVEDGEIPANDVLEIFLITESYLFRRSICGLQSSNNKVFPALNAEILRYDTTANDYLSKFIYTLEAKKESSSFPDDEKFAAALEEKQVYRMNRESKNYLLERFENYGTKETHDDIYSKLEDGKLSIEHIMPQTLTPAWREALGSDYEEIHETWLHRLANLTLTGYNSSLSNKTFQEKRDEEEGGYKASGLRMNQEIKLKESWGLPELQERSEKMVALAKKIWMYPKTEFKPKEKVLDSCTLDDDEVELLKGRTIVKFRLLDCEQPVRKWTEMLEQVVKMLHQRDKSILSSLAEQDSDLGKYVRSNERELRKAMKIDDRIYIESHSNTETKITLLRRLFDLYKINPASLTFYLKTDEESELEP